MSAPEGSAADVPSGTPSDALPDDALPDDALPDDDFVAVAADDELWDGEMEAYDVGDAEVLVVKIDGGYRAFDGICPHQSVSLVEGSLEGATLTCRAHEWSFDARSGAGVNPRTACLVRHAVRVRDGQVLVSRTPLPAAEPTAEPAL